MKSVSTLKFLLFFLFTLNLFSQNDPNIILIIADDMGWSQVSTPLTNLNNPSDFYETPNLETLATEGIAFTHAYVNGANCAPTRAALLSGQYAARPHNNIYNVEDLNRGNTSLNSTLIGSDMGLASNGNIDEIPSSAITIAETMKTAGYITGHWGKYHVGENEDSNFSHNAPTDQGFDYNYGGGTAGGPGDYFASAGAPYAFGENIGLELDIYANPYTEAESQLLAGNSSLTGTAKHVTDALTEAAIDFMETEKSNPFFMQFSNYAIHGPFNSDDARPDLRAKYDAKAISNPGSMDHSSTPGQAALAEGMDQSIGRLIDYLKTTDDPRNPGKKLSENTLVYFISDNGDAVKRTPQAPLRGMKGEYYEGGIRSVTIAWSEGTWLANKGTINSTPIIAFDLYPTFVEAANGTLPNNYDIDGVSQWQMLTNGSAMTREAIYWHFPGYLIDSKRDSRPISAIRKGDYKLIYNYESESYEMYDLISDMSESNNLLLGSPDSSILVIANNMSSLLINHLTETAAPLPTYRSDGTTVALPYVIDISGASNSVDGCQAPTGYEAYWDFDYASNSNDASSNGHNPIATTGTLQFDTEDYREGDRSAIFNGFTKIQYDNDPFLKAATNVRSVSLWLKPSALNGIQNIYDEGGKTKGIGLRLNDANLELIVRSNSSNSEQISSVYPNDGAWHQVVLVYDGANTSLKLYIDAVEVASGTNAPLSIGNHSGSGIGGKVGGADSFANTSEFYFNGKMDAFAVYESVLSTTAIENGYCEETPPVEANAGPDVTICDGDSTTLTASGGTSYLWSTGATTASINVSPSLTNTYMVTVSDGITNDNDDVIVTVNSLPVADAGTDVSICDGDSTTLTASGGE
ncbi:MAG: sulfatase-like hydrolase/transferase, partial [Urechidicola sp.]|nr:sulfatase-like hydrolase/transferase [Urechidicola sp.]